MNKNTVIIIRIVDHINNIFSEGELDKKSNVHFLHIANSDKPITLYNLDVIISVGYRIKSPRGTQFRIWAREITIVLIDNFVDESVLILLSKRESGVNAMIITRKISEQLQLDLTKHNAQYPPIAIEERPNIHDRFLLIDNDLYHIGASLKDLGKKLFAFSKMEMMAKELLKNIYAVNDFKK